MKSNTNNFQRDADQPTEGGEAEICAYCGYGLPNHEERCLVATLTTQIEELKRERREVAERAWDAAVNREDWVNYFAFKPRPEPPDRATYLTQFNNPDDGIK